MLPREFISTSDFLAFRLPLFIDPPTDPNIRKDPNAAGLIISF